MSPLFCRLMSPRTPPFHFHAAPTRRDSVAHAAEMFDCRAIVYDDAGDTSTVRASAHDAHAVAAHARQARRQKNKR
jgi:hypothetical protein